MSRGVLLFYSFAAVCLSVLAVTPADVQNQQFDSIIEKIVTQIKSSKLNQVAIPSFSLLNGVVSMVNGSVRDFSSLTRVGDATVMSSSTGMTIKGSVNFTVLEADFDKFEIALGILPKIGGSSAAITFGEDQIDLDVTVNLDPSAGKCGVTVNQIDLSKLGGIQIIFGQWSIVNWLIQYLAPIFLNVFAGTLVSVLGNSVATVAQSFLSNLNLCP